MASSTPFDLTGKVILVTGGNSGIGLGMAEGLARAGGKIAIWGGNSAKLESAKKQLERHGTQVLTEICDVANEAQVENATNRLLDKFGRLDGCFANAGVSKRAPFHELATEDWRRVIGINLDGVFFTLRAASRHMVARAKAGDPGGRLVVTSSIAAVVGPAQGAAYAASKGALLPLIRSLAVEFARYGITANAILPGWIETEMTAGRVADPKFSNAVLPRIPMRRWGTPDDFAGMAVYLMSDASRYHTGDNMRIDGAYTLY
jgi:NAD(P)-dependent dehydrogenase (short-subunit alcohol dehydrogenase family)